MKQVELAQQLGISKSYLSMILSGKRTPNTELARRISSLEVHKFEPNSPCKGGALPIELQPQIAVEIIAYMKLFFLFVPCQVSRIVAILDASPDGDIISYGF